MRVLDWILVKCDNVLANSFKHGWGVSLPVKECGKGYKQGFIVVTSAEHHKHDPTVKQRLTVQLVIVALEYNRVIAQHQWDIIVKKIYESEKLHTLAFTKA